MEELHTSYQHPFHPIRAAGSSTQSTTSRDAWEDWEDDEPVTPIDERDGPLIEVTGTSPNKTAKALQPRISNAKRQSVQRLSRLKSRRRLKGQNAKIGIRLDTDVAKFRHQQHPPVPMNNQQPAPERKFVDAAALKALEGSPSTATVGSFHWLRKKKDKGKAKAIAAYEMTPTPVDNGLSPNNKIMIGIELPEGAERTISPQTAVVETPHEFPIMLSPPLPPQTQPLRLQQPQVSVWSPDTEYTNSAYPSSAGGVSLRSQPFSPDQGGDIPPVPALPANSNRGRRRTTLIEDDDDLTTPVTLFEEGSPIVARKSFKMAKTPMSASRSQGWWDQILSPFVASPLPMSPEEEGGRRNEEEWWRDTDEKNRSQQERSLASRRQTELSIVAPIDLEKQALARVVEEAETSPTVASSSRSSEQRQTENPHAAAIERAQPSAVPSEAPPPYSPPPQRKQRVPVRYRAVFPPGHDLNATYPPSPGPPSAIMPGTMTSQGAVHMSEVPLTPPPVGTAPLPPRPVGSFVPGEHFLADLGRGHRQDVERQRRRHEKEDYLARRVGGFWRGRWCIPATGCFGRPGREGRKKRRVCCGILAGLIALIVAGVVLGVMLTRPHAPAPAPYSPWLNLTDFPPMPTGVSTMVGEDLALINQACVNPPTMWQCTLPKELASEAAPFKPNQPKFIFDIQFDNSTAWNATSYNKPPLSRRALRNYASGFRFLKRDSPPPAFTPNPPPPILEEMWFLGNTTDSILSPLKAGEPTPFYITLLPSLPASSPTTTSTVTAPLTARANEPDDGKPLNYLNTTNFPTPLLTPSGTGAPAILHPHPISQPLRLYDRGLPTEHYGFYTYFNKTTYLKSATALPLNTSSPSSSSNPVPTDTDGGALLSEAKFLLIWVSTRFKVEIYTRLSPDSNRFVGGNPLTTTLGTVGNDTRPGSFPYPVSVSLDTHGGDEIHKGTWAYRVDDRQKIDVKNFLLVGNDMGRETVNPLGGKGNDKTLGGIDGGKGGCGCEWRNWVGTNGG